MIRQRAVALPPEPLPFADTHVDDPDQLSIYDALEEGTR